MSSEWSCTECGWSDEAVATETVQPYCPRCGEDTELEWEPEVNMRGAETKSDKI